MSPCPCTQYARIERLPQRPRLIDELSASTPTFVCVAAQTTVIVLTVLGA